MNKKQYTGLNLGEINKKETIKDGPFTKKPYIYILFFIEMNLPCICAWYPPT